MVVQNTKSAYHPRRSFAATGAECLSWVKNGSFLNEINESAYYRTAEGIVAIARNGGLGQKEKFGNLRCPLQCQRPLASLPNCQ